MALRRTEDPMTAESFVSWNEAQPAGARHELLDGIIFAMGAERAAHARTKTRVYNRLERQIAERALPCEAFLDGMAVRVDEATVFEPDALVRCGAPIPGDTILIEDPIIVLEVASPPRNGWTS